MLGPIKIYKEQRQFPRVSFDSPLRFQIKSTHKFGSTVCRDISEGGIRFLTEDFVPIGTSIVLEVNLGVLPKVINAVADVVWSQKMAHSDRYQVGLKFCEMDEPYHQDVCEYVKSRRF
ncbi:MAG: PilZ domain-containing protein [Candidatus Omnitrophota bacterium]|nr:PilZ domain-containing protein [Candidatus Omnitrophota bacterium]